MAFCHTDQGGSVGVAEVAPAHTQDERHSVVSKYGLTVEYEQYDSYYEARQGEHNCSDGSIIAGDFRHTACLRFGDAVDVGGNRLGAILRDAPGRCRVW